MAITQKSNVSVFFANLLLFVGIVNHLGFLAVTYNICAVSNFTCRGESAGAEGMAYAFSWLIPQVIIEASVLIGLVFFAIICILKSTNKYLNTLFLITLLFAILANYFV